MKPRIYWYKEGFCYICEITEEDFYTASDEEGFLLFACGVGYTPKEAYEDWIEDCQR